MEKSRKIELLADILDVAPEDISEEKKLREIGDWDSLVILSFIGMMGEEFKKEVSVDELEKIITVADAFAMME